MRDQRCKIIKPFSAVRYHDQAARRLFRAGEEVLYDFDQSTGMVVFKVDNDPWIIVREVLLGSIEILNPAAGQAARPS
jgi:hypothetical protein